jgi:hypothetical protein
MKIALFELHEWEDRFIRVRLDAGHEVVARPGVLEDADLAGIAEAEVVSPVCMTGERARRPFHSVSL